LTLINTTVSGNTIPSGSATIATSGINTSLPAKLTLWNSIVAGNTSAFGTPLN